MNTPHSSGNRPVGLVPEDINAMRPWSQNLHLPGGIQTAPEHPCGDFPAAQWAQIAPSIPRDLAGWRVLDVGCNAGFYSLEFGRRGAEVVGTDPDAHCLGQARWAADQLGLADRVCFRQMHLYELARSTDQYDLVCFMGALCRLRYPLLAVDILADMAVQLLVVQSCGPTSPDQPDAPDRANDAPPAMAYVAADSSAESTRQWVINRAGFQALFAGVGFEIVGEPTDQVYVCEPNQGGPKPSAQRGQRPGSTWRLPPLSDGL